MMKANILHKITSATMAILVLFSTLSFTVEKHFCGDYLVDVAVFTDADKCGSEASDSEISKPCCKDTIDVIEGQDELQNLAFNDFNLDQQQFIKAFAISYVNLFEGLPQQYVPHKAYSPPNLVIDIQVLDEVYLI